MPSDEGGATQKTSIIAGMAGAAAHNDQALWAEARTLVELGELMAQWLEGTISYQPAYGAPHPDDETNELVPALAAINRAGFVTVNSQPGIPQSGDGSMQRAWVTGFCDEATKNRINDSIVSTDLVILTCAPGEECDYMRLCITMDVGEEFTWVGGRMSSESIHDDYADDLHPDGLEALHSAWQLILVDPVWGRNDQLWPAILAALP